MQPPDLIGGRRGARRAVATVALLLVGAALGPGRGAVADEPRPAAPGAVTSGTVVSNGTAHPYLLYTPRPHRPGSPQPLVVVVHGCQTTAQQEMELTRYNELAEREGFLVLYPEVDALAQQLPGPLAHCWRFFDPTAYVRGTSDPAAIAEATRRVMRDRAIDPERVYLLGVSAGGLMAAVGGAAYPELYAAVALVATAGFADAPCFTTGIGIPVELSAQLAFAQMGPRARVVPTMAIGSDADAAFPARCTEKAVEQSLRTANLVLSGSQTSPLALAPATVHERQEPDGLATTVSTFLDPGGCPVAERWIVHGMPHAWPGGAEYGGYTDTRAPDGAEATWAFLQLHRRSETSVPCTERATAGSTPPPATGEPEPPASGVDPPVTSGGGASTPSAPVSDRTRLPATGAQAAPVVAAVLVAAALALRRVLAAARAGAPRHR